MRRIYFIGDGRGHVKIGISSNPAARLATLQTGTVSKLDLYGWISGDLGDEKLLHDYFSDDHVFGEWFKLTDRFSEFMECIRHDFRPGMTARDVIDAIYDLCDARWHCGAFLYDRNAWAGAAQSSHRGEGV